MVDLLHGPEVFFYLGGELLDWKEQAVIKFSPRDRFNPQFSIIESDHCGSIIIVLEFG